MLTYTGNDCVCGNSLGPGASPASFGSCNIACSGNGAENCGGAAAMQVYTIVNRGGGQTSVSSSSNPPTTTMPALFPSPTSTGIPNCFDRSPFDGTVNSGYLILCNTDLSGYDLASVAGNSVSDCINACNSYPPQQSPGQCVAVEYDIVSEQCIVLNQEAHFTRMPRPRQLAG